MTETIPSDNPKISRKSRNWNVSVVVGTLVGLLALMVSSYTAVIQRQQVRAQVWPYLLASNDDPEQAIEVLNKGVGPALVRSVQVWIDGRPQRSWDAALQTLGIPPHGYQNSTLNENVLSAGEQITWIRIAERSTYLRFRDAYRTRIGMAVCFCSTLGDCWVYSRRTPGNRPEQKQVGQCPVVASQAAFAD
jgi:hypothetical protein